jgi:hypothetical protein
MWTKIKTILALRRDVDELKAEMKVMRDEWEDWFDRFKRLHARIARRQQRDEQSLEREAAQPGGEQETPISSLSPRAQQVQREILAARNRGRNGGGE